MRLDHHHRMFDSGQYQHARLFHSLLSLSADLSAAGEPEIGMVCIPNISPREQRRRLAGGVISLVIGLGVLAALVVRGVNRWWRLPLFLLFWAAGSGFFQWRDKT